MSKSSIHVCDMTFCVILTEDIYLCVFVEKSSALGLTPIIPMLDFN